MKHLSLRFKVALAAAGLSSLIVILFTVVSATWYYYEQLDALNDGTAVMNSAANRSEAWAEVLELAFAYLVSLPVVAVSVAIGAWWLAGHVTKPLTTFAHAAERIDAKSLNARLPEPDSHDEIALLAKVINGLLARLEKSFSQASRFAADASHELRTPLAIMRGTLEQAIQDDPNGPQTPIFVSLLEENQRLTAIAEKLLLLARADAGELCMEKQEIDMTALVNDIADDFSILAEDHALRMETEVTPGIYLKGDADLLRHLIINLFDNAIRHNLPKGWIRVQLTSEGPLVAFTISNSSIPIDNKAQSRLFRRFFRKDTSRERGTGGAGLGLSLCSEIANAHKGQLSLVVSDESQTTFKLELPAGRGNA